MTDNESVVLLSKEDQAVLGEVNDENISPKVLEHATHPCNLGWINNPDGQASVTGICEDTVSICLRLEGPIVKNARFQANGCGFTVACASVATELVRGKSLKHALRISGEQIFSCLGGLPKEHAHCADLAANALKGAVKDALEHLKEPWKRAYQTFGQ
jgi:nitrogen fixation NifU-like protein